MKKFFQKKSVAVTVLVLAILLSGAYGLMHKPAALPKVQSGQWVQDDAGVLSAETETLIRRYDEAWDSSYYAVAAVATVDSTAGWDDLQEYTAELGNNWGLGLNDLLVLIDTSGNWYINGGSEALGRMSDQDIAALTAAFTGGFDAEDYDAAVETLFQRLDGWYASAYGGTQREEQPGYSGSYDYSESGWQSSTSVASIAVSLVMVILLLIVISAVIDLFRYRRYQRRYVRRSIVPPTPYMPVFWGRRPRRPRAPRPPKPPRRPTPPRNDHRPPSGGPRGGGSFGGGSRPGGSFGGGSFGGSRPSGGSRPGGTSRPSRPSGGSFGGGGFGSGSRSTRGGSFGGGGFGGSRGGGSRGGSFGGGSRGGFGGGRGGHR